VWYLGTILTVTVGLAVNGSHPLARSATARSWANDCDRTQLGWITDRFEGPSSGLFIESELWI